MKPSIVVRNVARPTLTVFATIQAGMCASAAQPRSGFAPMMPTRILLVMMPC